MKKIFSRSDIWDIHICLLVFIKHQNMIHVIHLYQLRHSIEIGGTWFSEKEIDQIVNDLKPFYRGLDYHTTNKNSIHFAKYLLEQLSNEFSIKTS